jgi:hypothetical protein
MPAPFDPHAFFEDFDAANAHRLVGLTLTTASGEEIEGVCQGVEEGAAVLTTATGRRAVPIDSVVGILMHVQSLGPE